MLNQPLSPFATAYWVLPERLLAGEHPALQSAASNQKRMQQLLQAGVTVFIDLTEPDETVDLMLYPPLAQALNHRADVRLEFHRFPIRDMHVPAPSVMHAILAVIDQALAQQRTIYLHCWAGIGRTGTVIGCYLVRQGRSGEAALAEIAHLRQHTLDARYPSPSEKTQRQFVYTWPNGDDDETSE
jgi:predicted protein tyrosine phosphatase